MEALPENLTTRLLDPLNRIYRSKIASKLALVASKTPISANQITFLHTAVGVWAAIQMYQQHYVLAVIFMEIRTILDCTDGILARMKGESTPLGRTLDSIGDAVAFNSIMIAGALRMIHDFHQYYPSLIIIVVFFFALLGAQSGNVYQLMKRKLSSIMFSQIDTVEREWRDQSHEVRTGRASLLTQFGFWLDSVTIRFVSEEWYEKIERRRNAEDWEARALKDAQTMNELARITRKREFRNAVRWTAAVSDDNIYVVMGFSLLVTELFPSQIFPYVHPVLIAFGLGFVYAGVSLMVGLYFLHQFYHGVYRD